MGSNSLPVFIPGRPYTLPSDVKRAEHLLKVAEFLWDDAHPCPRAGERDEAFAAIAQRLGVTV